MFSVVLTQSWYNLSILCLNIHIYRKSKSDFLDITNVWEINTCIDLTLSIHILLKYGIYTIKSCPSDATLCIIYTRCTMVGTTCVTWSAWFGWLTLFNATLHTISLYRGGLFYWWRKLEYPEKTTDLPQVTVYHIMLYEFISPWTGFELTTLDNVWSIHFILHWTVHHAVQYQLHVRPKISGENVVL